MAPSSKQYGSQCQPRLLVVGRLLKVQGNGRREKVAEELKAFARQGFIIDCVTLDDAAPDILSEYQLALKGIVRKWFVWRDPLLTVIRAITRARKWWKKDAESDPGRERQRPRMRPDHPLNMLFSLPDPNIGWYFAHRKRLNRLVTTGGYTHLYTLSSPHSIQLVGLYVKERSQALIWKISFRDPWSTYPLQHPAKWITAFNQRLERHCLEACEQAVIYRGWTPRGLQGYKDIYGDKLAGKVFEAPYIGCNEQGIDQILEEYKGLSHTRNNTLQFIHLGTLYGHDHTPRPFLQALGMYLAKSGDLDIEIKVLFLGGITADAESMLANSDLLRKHVAVKDYVPYAEAIRHLAEADVALWFQAEHAHFSENIPAKVFEYVYLQLPVMSISSSAKCTRILEQYGLGTIYLGRDIDSITNGIDNFVCMKARGESLKVCGTRPFSRRHFVQCFEEAVAKPSATEYS